MYDDLEEAAGLGQTSNNNGTNNNNNNNSNSNSNNNRNNSSNNSSNNNRNNRNNRNNNQNNRNKPPPERASFVNAIHSNYFGEEDDVRSTLEQNLSVHTIKRSDTRVPDSSSMPNSSFAPYEFSAGSSIHSGSHDQFQHGSQHQPKKRAFERADKRQRIHGDVAPAFLPIASTISEPDRRGFQFQRPRREDDPRSNIITIDPENQTIDYRGNSRENRRPSTDPDHPSNGALQGVFGTTRVEMAGGPSNKLTPGNLDRLRREQPGQTGSNMGPPSDVAFSNAGSAPSGRPSSRPLSGYSASQGGNESVDSDRTTRPSASADIDEDIRRNFIRPNELLTHQMEQTKFQRDNNEWMPVSFGGGSGGPTKYMNNIGVGNVHKMETQAETRVMDWDEEGNYTGGVNQGAVKKRIRLGYIDMRQKLESEMIQANEMYRELRRMSPAERFQALTAMRNPMSMWLKGPGAAAEDIFETNLDVYYQKQWDASKARRLRLERLMRLEAASRSRASASSQSGRSQQTETSASIAGKLGDLDVALPSKRLLINFNGAQYTSRNSVAHVGVMSERAVGALARQNAPKATGNVGSHHRRPASSSSSIPRAGGVELDFAGSTGYSVAGPRSAASQDDFPVLGSQPSTARRPGAYSSSRATSSATNQGRNGTASVRTDFAALLEFDDSPLLADAVDVSFPYQQSLSEDQLMIQKEIVRQSSTRGRVVVVRLHDQVQFSGHAIAKRVFGGIVQEFQLHPEQNTAVIIFVHPVEAHSFLSHVERVRTGGTEQEIRELQIEAAWYNGHEKDSVVVPQPNIVSYHIAVGATRALMIHNIDQRKSYNVVAEDLGKRLGKLFLFMTLQSPIEKHKLPIEGRIAIVEFASLADAIQAHLDLETGLVVGYENSDPKFVPERSSKPAPDKPYCQCLGCRDRRKMSDSKKMGKIQKLRNERDNYLSARGSASRSGTAQMSSNLSSSAAAGSTNGSTSGAQDSGDLIHFSDDDNDVVEEEEEELGW